MAGIEWRRICCPIDFSEPSRAGLRVAVDLCRRLDAELILMHADAGPRVAEEPRSGSVDDQLQAFKEAAQRLGAPRVEVARAPGPPEVAIVEFAGARGVDLLVIGTHGRVDRERMLVGSVAEGVVRNAPCPVLTVRPTWKA